MVSICTLAIARAKTSILPIIFSILFLQIGFAQDLETFVKLKSEGSIPKEITSSSAKKYKVLESKVETIKDSRRKQKQKRKFLLESTYAIDEMMKNGLIIFNDPVSDYVKQVSNELLKGKPEIKEKVKFYTVRSAQVNAFATDRGAIFINLGLLAKLETEAQLAFIMAHEITHVLERHNMDVFLEYEDISSSNGGFKKGNDFDQLLHKSNYSKKIEKEADEGGLELFLESSYGTSSLEGVFDMLATAHVPFTNEVFDLSYLNIGNVKFHDSILLEKVNPIQRYDEDEKLSTHPGVKNRKEKLASSISTEKASLNKQDFIIGENKFTRIKELAQFEICNILVENLSYPAAIYHSSVLAGKYPGNLFLEKIKLKSLYGLSKYVGEYSKSDFFEETDNLQGEMQQVYHFFEEMSNAELRSLAAAHLWKFNQKNPDDKGMRLRLEDVLMEMNDRDKFKIKEFTGEDAESDLMTKGIFAEYHKIAEFKELLEQERKEEVNEKGSLEKGYRLGLDKVVFINPNYVKVNLKKKKQPIRFIESENRQKDMIDMIKKNGKRLNLGTKFMDIDALGKKSKADKFNDIITLERWAMQKINHPYGMIPDNYNEAKEIMNANKIKHIAFIGALSLRDKKSIGSYIGNGILAASILFTPQGIFDMAKPNVKSFFYTIVLDTEKQDVMMYSYNVMSQKDKNGILNANLYWLMLQMKKQPK